MRRALRPDPDGEFVDHGLEIGFRHGDVDTASHLRAHRLSKSVAVPQA
jgi:hypothetical protein